MKYDTTSNSLKTEMFFVFFFIHVGLKIQNCTRESKTTSNLVDVPVSCGKINMLQVQQEKIEMFKNKIRNLNG